MVRKVVSCLTIAVLALFCSITLFAGEWRQDANGWWYCRDDGSYPAGQWEWIDGNGDGIAECYYFHENGYMAQNEAIDGSVVNNDGQWMELGEVQTRKTENAVQSTVPVPPSKTITDMFVAGKAADYESYYVCPPGTELVTYYLYNENVIPNIEITPYLYSLYAESYRVPVIEEFDTYYAVADVVITVAIGGRGESFVELFKLDPTTVYIRKDAKVVYDNVMAGLDSNAVLDIASGKIDSMTAERFYNTYHRFTLDNRAINWGMTPELNSYGTFTHFDEKGYIDRLCIHIYEE